jgi:hypothetical protein
MSLQTWREILTTATVDGPTLTAASAASAVPVNCRITLPNNFWYVGRMMKITAAGRISNAVTTPGTARFDVRTGPSGTIIAYDTGALNLNTTAKTTVPFWLDIMLTCRAIGNSTLTTLMGVGNFQSEAVVGSPANTAGSNGALLAPVGAPAVGTGFDNTAANVIDLFFTQTVATGSMTIHQYLVEAMN